MGFIGPRRGRLETNPRPARGAGRSAAPPRPAAGAGAGRGARTPFSRDRRLPMTGGTAGDPPRAAARTRARAPGESP